jgi:hypothetical protein
MVRKNKKRSNKKKIVLIVIIVVLAVLSSIFAYYYFTDEKPATSNTAGSSPSPTNEPKINLDPPTDDEKKDSDRAKDVIVDQQQNPTPTTNTVTPIVTYADYNNATKQLEVGAFVSGVVQDGGTCTFKLTKGSQTFTKQTTGFANAQNTGCPALSANRSDIPSSGTWSVVVSYSSTSHSGVSQNQTTVDIE